MQQHRYLLSMLLICHALVAIVSSLPPGFIDNHWRTHCTYANCRSLGSLQPAYFHNHSSYSFMHVTRAADTHHVCSLSPVHDHTYGSCVDCICSLVSNLSSPWDDLDLRLLVSGLPPHPGPGGFTEVSLRLWNVNSLSKFLPIIATYKFDVCFAQEISAPWHMLSAVYTRLKSLNYKALLAGTDPETVKTGKGGGCFDFWKKFYDQT